MKKYRKVYILHSVKDALYREFLARSSYWITMEGIFVLVIAIATVVSFFMGDTHTKYAGVNSSVKLYLVDASVAIPSMNFEV